jgi:hypothetical protein
VYGDLLPYRCPLCREEHRTLRGFVLHLRESEGVLDPADRAAYVDLAKAACLEEARREYALAPHNTREPP